MKHKIYIVGIGPGAEELMTKQVYEVLRDCDTIVGYPVYLNLLGEAFAEKEMLSTPMRNRSAVFCAFKRRGRENG